MFDPKIQQMQIEQMQGQNVMQGGPGLESPGPVLPEQAPQQKLMKSLFEEEKALEPQQKLLNELKKLNIDPTGINLTKLGKFNLSAKLQKRFGEGYEKVTGVRDILSLFDSYMNSSDGRIAQAKQDSVMERTLSALGKI